MKYASQYALSVKDAVKVLSSQVFIICLIIVGRRLLLIAQRKKSEKTRPRARAVLLFFCFAICDYELFQRTPIWSPIIF